MQQQLMDISVSLDGVGSQSQRHQSQGRRLSVRVKVVQRYTFLAMSARLAQLAQTVVATEWVRLALVTMATGVSQAGIGYYS
jgi:hypothetical protein